MRNVLLLLALLGVGGRVARAQDLSVGQPPALAQPEAPASAPLVITLPDAIERARQNDAQFQAIAAEAEIAREDRVQAKASLLPVLSNSTQFLGNSANGVNPNGRFVSLDGVQMYREWLVLPRKCRRTRSCGRRYNEHTQPNWQRKPSAKWQPAVSSSR
jgi:outer membrane protein TolC